MGTPTLSEIKQKYRSPKDKEGNFDWWTRNILSPLSLPFSKFFMGTNITANQINFLWIIIGALGALLLAFGSYWLSIAGVILLQFYFVLDLADGPVARYKNIVSNEGSFIHIMGHNIIDAFTFMGLTIGVYMRYSPSVWIIVLGFLACISIIVWGLIFARKVEIYYKKGLYLQEKKEKAEKIKAPSFIAKIYAGFVYLFRGVPITNFLTIAAIFDALYIPLYFYGIFFLPFVAAVFIYEYKRGFGWVKNIRNE